MARSHVMLWTGALVAACLAAAASANCGSRCTDTTFRAYASCLQSCGADVAVTTCDCSAMACARCPGDNSCCQTCCNIKQCVCSNVNCQQPCNSPCCAMCCQPPVEQTQCGSCASGCQQPSPACSPCCQQQQQQQQQTTTTTTTTTTSRPPSNPNQTPPPSNPNQPPPPPPPPPPPQGPIYVNVSSAPNYVNVSLGNITVSPANITVLPANISFTPNITVIVNTSPISQVYPTQYAGNVSLTFEQQGTAMNCSNGRRRCCRIVMVPSAPCPPGANCPPPIERYACGDRCTTIIRQPVYYYPWPVYYYYPVYYERPYYVYVPQPPHYFCSSGCVPMPTWPFARCFDTMPYSATAAASLPQYFQPYGSAEAAPDAAAAAAATATNAQG